MVHSLEADMAARELRWSHERDGLRIRLDACEHALEIAMSERQAFQVERHMLQEELTGMEAALHPQIARSPPTTRPTGDSSLSSDDDEPPSTPGVGSSSFEPRLRRRPGSVERGRAWRDRMLSGQAKPVWVPLLSPSLRLATATPPDRADVDEDCAIIYEIESKRALESLRSSEQTNMRLLSSQLAISRLEVARLHSQSTSLKEELATLSMRSRTDTRASGAPFTRSPPPRLTSVGEARCGLAPVTTFWADDPGPFSTPIGLKSHVEDEDPWPDTSRRSATRPREEMRELNQLVATRSMSPSPTLGTDVNAFRIQENESHRLLVESMRPHGTEHFPSLAPAFGARLRELRQALDLPLAPAPTPHHSDLVLLSIHIHEPSSRTPATAAPWK